MSLKFILATTFFLLPAYGYMQTIPAKEEAGLHNIIRQYLNHHEASFNAVNSHGMEFILISLETDSSGSIYVIHMMNDNQEKDSGYAVLSRIEIPEFSKWKCPNCKNMVIVIPFYFVRSDDDYNYGKELARSMILSSVRNEKSRLIVTKQMVYRMPYYLTDPKEPAIGH